MQFRKVYRVTTFVPPEKVDAVIKSIVAVDPLGHGHYDRVCWRSSGGVEQFRPLEGADPTYGKIGEVAHSSTVRLEFVLPLNPETLRRVLELGLFPAHPWEEPAVFIDETTTTVTSREKT
ncbi:MAG: hypothetical protein ABI682_06655 [Acidobacteriota bacterium]